ncbi:DUF2391 domain-containing protein [Halopenitus salinus]|uniref:DUF2391 domain-containing protein n=1 Tax=Halopenitus salinus TaxID=1198295 RepID=A0ABD5UVQ7_9EURY
MSADRPDEEEDTLEDHGPEDPDVGDLLRKLDALEETVDDPHERRKVQQTISLVERMPGSTAFSEHIYKYTSRDMAEALVGGVIFALPFLVEDGVFLIAEWFLAVRIAAVPVLLLANVFFVLVLSAGLIYYADIREVRVTNPILGVIPRRYVGVLALSFAVAGVLMAMWGRLAIDDPTPLEAFARVTVVWTATVLGSALGDILPGESKGEDISEMFDDDD